jgi:hypothetical protein
MKKAKTARKFLLIFAILAGLFVIGCAQPTSSTPAVAPTVTAVAPANAATSVALNPTITATFSAAMTPATIIAANFTLKAGAAAVAGTVTYTAASKVATFVPTASLAASTAYTATITTGVKDSAGTALAANKVWTFTTGTATVVTPPPGDVAPTVLSTVPIDTSDGAIVNNPIDVTFSEAMLPGSLLAAGTFTLTGPGTTVVTGVVTNTSTTTARFTPDASLAIDTVFTATITTAAQDAAGTAMAATKSWTFFTGTRPANPLAPPLGETARFVLLAPLAMSTTGVTTISNGALGLFTNGRSSYSGFTPGAAPGSFAELTNGLSYATDDSDPSLIPSPYATTLAFLVQVSSDLTALNNFLGATNTGAANQPLAGLSGTTLTRGVYVTGANVTITGSDLTLDAQGDVNSVWIFVIGGTFATVTGGNIVLTNGAQAKNVYWRTAGNTSLAATNFSGTVVASPTVAVSSTVTVSGSLFAMTNQVTLIGDTITKAP